jgi:hypothetical protein
LDSELANYWSSIREVRLPSDNVNDWLDEPGKRALLQENWPA